MVIGGKKDTVIENIKEATESKEYNKKVEENDPKLSNEEKTEIINEFLENKDKHTYRVKNMLARAIISVVSARENKDTEIVGLENIKEIEGGAIVTSNHFNPLDSTVVRKFAKKAGKRRLYIVAQETNLAMDGLLGFIMNNADIIPISGQVSYMKSKFPDLVKELLDDGNFILIYPEQEMWFNYRKPRSLKPGAYYYAIKNNVPIIPCFVEIEDKEKSDTEEFKKVKYTIHVLKPIYPDRKKSIKENTEIMLKNDYEQKKKAYEEAYGKELDYTFDISDIAGWEGSNM